MSLALPALIGAGAAGATALGLLAAGIARSRAVAPVVLVAVASFYPVFAAERGADQLWPLLGLSAFAVLALLAARIAPRLAALGLMAHGLYDTAMAQTTLAAPDWWPAFCGSYDIALGLFLLLISKKGELNHD